MKKFSVKKLLSVALALVLVAGLVGGVVALADASDPQVLYNGGAEQFEFKNAAPFDTNTQVDLFADIKGAMPGDSFEQTITVGVENTGSDTVNMQLFAQNPNADYLKLITASNEVKNPAKLSVYDGATLISETMLTAGGCALGNFSNNQTKELKVEFSIPPEAGNELSDLVAQIDWVFKATVIPNQPSGPAEPSGGDPEPIDPDPDPDVEQLGELELDRINHFGYIVGRGGNGVQPEANITRAEVATIFFRLLTDESREKNWRQTNDYSDVSATAWYNNAISTLTYGKVLEGYPDGTARPGNYITRAEFAAMATRFYKESGVYSQDAFNDISDNWARNSINRAAELGLISGYGDGSFRPNQNITRAEAIQLINNVLERCPNKDNLLPDMITWVDNMDTAKWYYAAVQEATNSHDYDLITDDATGESFEVWTELLPVRDWVALEKQWSTANSIKAS